MHTNRGISARESGDVALGCAAPMSPPAAGDHAPDEHPVADAIHAALAERIGRRRADEEFQQPLKHAIERQREALDLLAD